MMHNPAHPGEMIREHMKGLDLTVSALSRVMNGKAGVSAEMVLRLSEAFGTSAEVWVRVQAQHDLWQANHA